MDPKAEQMPKQMEVDGDSLDQNLQELSVKEFKDMYHSLPEHCKSSNRSKICSTHDIVLNFFGRHPVLDRRPSCPPGAKGFEDLRKKQNAMKILEIAQLMGKMVEDQQKLGEELKITKENLQGSEREIANLRHENRSSVGHLKEELGLAAQKDLASWKVKVKSLSEENMLLQAKITKLSKEKAYLEVNAKEWKLRCQTLEKEAKRVKVGKEEMECQLHAEITKLSKEQASLEDKFKERELRCQTLEEAKRVKAGKEEMECQLQVEITRLSKELASVEDKVKERELRCKTLEEEAKRVKAGKEEMERQIQAEITKLSKELASLVDKVKERELRCQTLEEEAKRVKTGKEEMERQLQAEITKLSKEQASLEDKVKECELHCQTLEEEAEQVKAGKEERERLLQAEIEQLKVVFESEKAELNVKISTLNDEVEKHRKKKPAAICLLCFYLPSFRSWYHRFRQAFVGDKRPSAKAS